MTTDNVLNRLDEMAAEYKRSIAAGRHKAARALTIEARKLVFPNCPDCGEPWDRTLCLECGWQARPVVLARPADPTPDAIPVAFARYAGIASPASGARRIIVDKCPYCGRTHRHIEALGETANQRLADCFRGEYLLQFDAAYARPAEVSEPVFVDQEPGGSGGGGGKVPADLRHPISARVFVPDYDDFGEIIDICQGSDSLWYYTIRLDGPGTIYDRTDADVIDRPDDTEPMPPLLVSTRPVAAPSATLSALASAPHRSSEAPDDPQSDRPAVALPPCAACGAPSEVPAADDGYFFCPDCNAKGQKIQDAACITTQCALCYSVQPCLDDGEAFICIDTQACRERCDYNNDQDRWRDAEAEEPKQATVGDLLLQAYDQDADYFLATFDRFGPPIQARITFAVAAALGRDPGDVDRAWVETRMVRI